MSEIDDFQAAMRARLKDPETWDQISTATAVGRMEDHLDRLFLDGLRSVDCVDLANWALIIWARLQKEERGGK